MIVSLTTYKRPQYLRETLAALDVAEAELLARTGEHTKLYVSIDKHDATFLDTWRLVHERPDTYAYVNPRILGCGGNTLIAVERAFVQKRGREDFVQHLEEDFVFAPDALCLAAYLRDTYRDDPEVLATGISTAHLATEDEFLQVHKNAWFHCQGWGTWRDRWDETLKPQWRATNARDTLVKIGDTAMGGWADNFNDRIFKETGGMQAIPRLTRVKHIGLLDGLHTTPATFKKDSPRNFAGDVAVPQGCYHA